MSGREAHVTRPDLRAECREPGCGWTAYRRNALGIAARHHDTTGHTVRVEIERVVYYGPIR